MEQQQRAHSPQPRLVIDPVCSGRVKSRCLSSSDEEGKVGRGVAAAAAAVWLGGKMTWRKEKVAFYKESGAERSFQSLLIWAVMSSEPRAEILLWKWLPPHLHHHHPSLPALTCSLINCHLQNSNASICSLPNHPPHLSCHFISVNKGGVKRLHQKLDEHEKRRLESIHGEQETRQDQRERDPRFDRPRKKQRVS